MTMVRSLTALTARLETATETLAEYIGYLNGEIDAEQDKAEPDAERVEALEQQLDIVIGERRAISPDNLALINRALYIYAPFLKLLRSST
ncbi:MULTISPECIES: hypothetical protein [pseudomallei group]|uniref:Uncharacterized protein n=1 Tax=Burkholderia savannae TaxID=1637837 RepID=A0ABR5TAE3_9BURK|nr:MULTISPECIES: hypothetical protein [pseudomallei group]AIV49824.1 putative epsilon antitoxin of the postsegregational killing system [Burkholderia pseudomallei TSV 48]KGC33294.1 hypothetical protein DO64_4133 [Burkholderia pseudomallei]KGW06058.1 hypothetical protein X899_1500 [Burkholderia pseudomallei TSV 25]KGW74516.1 putative epsilon antitoxin of the postsegregational killing system [Burkholderia pseudomallei MSHR2990]KIX55531.1 hypothetical protein SZ29_20400 [Burkholderia pseudomallei